MASRSFTRANMTFPLRCLGLVQRSSFCSKCLPFFRNGWLEIRNQWWPMYTTCLQCFIYVLSVLSIQWVQALYPLFDCSDKLLCAGQSLMLTNSNSCRLNYSCLSSSYTGTPSFFPGSFRCSSNGLRYTTMSLPGCSWHWIICTSASCIAKGEVVDTHGNRPSAMAATHLSK